MISKAFLQSEGIWCSRVYKGKEQILGFVGIKWLLKESPHDAKRSLNAESRYKEALSMGPKLLNGPVYRPV